MLWRAAEGAKATSHFLNLYYNGTYKLYIGVFASNDPTTITVQPDNVHYSYVWTPPADLDPGSLYSVMVSSPPSTTARSDGLSPFFNLKYPYQYLQGELGDCQLPFGTLCGAGFQRRTVTCQDLRPYELRLADGTIAAYPTPSPSPSPSANATYNCTLGNGTVVAVPLGFTPNGTNCSSTVVDTTPQLNLVDIRRCGPYGRPPPVLVSCYIPCTGQTQNNYVTGPFSPCSEPCGGGTRTRTVECVSPLGECASGGVCVGLGQSSRSGS